MEWERERAVERGWEQQSFGIQLEKYLHAATGGVVVVVVAVVDVAAVAIGAVHLFTKLPNFHKYSIRNEFKFETTRTCFASFGRFWSVLRVCVCCVWAFADIENTLCMDGFYDDSRQATLRFIPFHFFFSLFSFRILWVRSCAMWKNDNGAQRHVNVSVWTWTWNILFSFFYIRFSLNCTSRAYTLILANSFWYFLSQQRWLFLLFFCLYSSRTKSLLFICRHMETLFGFYHIFS